MIDKKRIMMIRPGKRFPRAGFGQPLGLLSLISVLRAHFPDRFVLDLVEQALYDLSSEEVRQRMLAFEPDLVLFSCLSVEADELNELTRITKSIFPEVPVWLGGPHATVLYDLELETGNVDAVCIGEGEQTFREMVAAWLDQKPLDGVAGLALLRDGAVITTAERPLIEDLDTLVLPAWDMVDFHKYSLQASMNTYVHSRPWALLFTSRACPFQCVYCHNIFGKKVRTRSVESVMGEIELLVNVHGVRELHIVDDIFNLDLDRAKAICDEIVSRKIKVKIAFPNGLRVDCMDRELIKKLKAAGCYCITYGVETASSRIQKIIKKNVDLDKVRQVIAWTDEEGIITQAFFMLGFPGETVEEIQMTIDFALSTRLTRPWFFTVVVYPRTGLHEIARQTYPDFDFSSYDFFNLPYSAEAPFYTVVTGVDLFKIQRDAYRAFLFRPAAIAKILIRFPKNMWLLRGMYWGLIAVIASLIRADRYLQPARKWLGRNLGVFKQSPPA
jgi:radical SAM superfamily enzyme YgiQ (UPF0313 family)